MTYIPGAVAAKIRARGMNVDVELERIRKRKEDERRLALFDKMLEALKYLLDNKCDCSAAGIDLCRKLVAKAEGK
jgi:hypothetical protein